MSSIYFMPVLYPWRITCDEKKKGEHFSMVFHVLEKSAVTGVIGVFSSTGATFRDTLYVSGGGGSKR